MIDIIMVKNVGLGLECYEIALLLSYLQNETTTRFESFLLDKRINMNAKNINVPSQTDWGRLERMNDDEIDYSDIPPLTDDFFQRAKLFPPQRAVILDADVFEWIQQQGTNPQMIVNTIIRKQMKRHPRLPKKLVQASS